MKCPLFSIAKAVAVSEGEEVCQDCGEGECAWWDDSMQMCLEKSRTLRLGAIYEQLCKIQAKMSHEGQFRK